MQGSLHDHQVLREYFLERAAAWRSDWHAIDHFERRWFSREEEELRQELLVTIESAIELVADLVRLNDGFGLFDRR